MMSVLLTSNDSVPLSRTGVIIISSSLSKGAKPDGKKMMLAVAVLLLFLGKMTLAQDEILLGGQHFPVHFVLGASTYDYQVYIQLPLVTYMKVKIN